MPHVRAKFRCAEATYMPEIRWADNVMQLRRFLFRPEYDPSIAEDRRFAKASPSGELTITVDNPAVNFTLGAYYYLDFTPVIEDAMTPDSHVRKH